MFSFTPYDSWAHLYDVLYEGAFGKLFRDFTNRQLALVPPNGPGKVLDAYARTGRLSIPLAQRGMDVTAVEPSRPMLAQLMAKAEQHGVLRRIRPINQWLHDHPADAIDDDHDYAICMFGSIHHSTDEHQVRTAIKCIASALKPGATAWIGVQPHELLADPAYASPHRVYVPVLGTEVSWRQSADLNPGSRRVLARGEITIPGQQTIRDEFPLYFWTADEIIDFATREGLHYVSATNFGPEKVLKFTKGAIR